MSASGAMASEEGAPSSSSSSTPIVRRVRIHKQRPIKDDTVPDAASNAAMDRRIAELIPALAELSVTAAEPSTSQLASASAVRQRVQSREEERRAEVLELGTLFDMSKPHPCEEELPAGGAGAWSQSLRPRVRKVVLSPYQYEMINYQRMLMRKNVWYYRDRMNVPRGPCPLHVLKDAWVQGVIDENTLMWGQGLYDWLPAKNVKLLLPMIRTPEVRLGAWMKRTFSLKPALNKIREARKDYRDPSELSKQVEYMR